MRFQICIDRFDGDHKEIAVLLLVDGRTVLFPRDLLPKGAKAGDSLSLTLDRDLSTTRTLARQARQIREAQGRNDSGGDIQL